MNRKFLSFVLCLCLVGLFTTACGSKSPFKNANVGDYVKMGIYPQTEAGEEQPIEWQVLAKEDKQVIVISRYALDAKRFDDDSNVWKNSEIRTWLNGDFYNKAFNEEDKKFINSVDGDNVFLLSKEEAEKYFANDDARICQGTKYAWKNGAFLFKEDAYWWLSSPNLDKATEAYYVDRHGAIYTHKIDDSTYAVRPVLKVKI